MIWIRATPYISSASLTVNLASESHGLLWTCHTRGLYHVDREVAQVLICNALFYFMPFEYLFFSITQINQISHFAEFDMRVSLLHIKF